MFGARPKTKGLFGKPWEAPSTPGIGDGMTQPEQPMMSAIRAPAEQPKRGLGTRLFGAGWEDKAFALGGMLRGDPTGAYMMRQEKQREQDALAQAAAEQRKRAEELADWRYKEDYKSANAAPDAFERALKGAGIDPASAEGQQLYRGRAEAMARDPNDEFVVVPIPGLGTYAGPRSGLQDAMGGAPQRPVGKLTPMGGGAGNSVGGF